MKIVAKKLQKFLLAFAVLFASIVLACTPVFAIGSIYKDYPEIYKQVAINFFEEQYKQQNIEYETVSVALESALYDSEENVVAKAMVVDRDGKYDYVVLNLTDCSIDEFSFDDSSAYEKFSEKTYYTGTLNYFTKESNKFKSVETGETYSFAEFEEVSEEITEKYEDFKSNASRTLSSNGNPLPNPNKNVYNGFYSFTDIDEFNQNNGYEFYDARFISGVTAGGLEDDPEKNLYFYSQTEFNARYGTKGSCLPTALANLCVLMDWCGVTNKDRVVNALYGDAYMTFNRFVELTGHKNDDAPDFDDVPEAFKTYALGQNYNYYIKAFLTTFEQFKYHIYNAYPIVTYLRLKRDQNPKNDFQHAVLTLGYVQYRYKNNTNSNEYTYTNYLRVVDGWSTSNAGRYIDFSGYWDVIEGTALRLVN